MFDFYQNFNYNFKKIGEDMKHEFDIFKFCVLSVISNLLILLVFLSIFGLFKILHIFSII